MIWTFHCYLQVLVTNQLTTKVGPANDSHLVPALGDSFGHYSNQRLMLGCLQHECYAAVLFKSVQRKQSSAKFQVIFITMCCIWHVIRKFLCLTMSYLCAIYYNFRYWRMVFGIAVRKQVCFPLCIMHWWVWQWQTKLLFVYYVYSKSIQLYKHICCDIWILITRYNAVN